MADKTYKGKRFVAMVDLGGIDLVAGDEFEVDDCNAHLDFETLLTTGAVELVRTARSPAGGEASKAEKVEVKPDALKSPAGGEGGR